MKLKQSNPKPIKSPRALSCVATLSDFFVFVSAGDGTASEHRHEQSGRSERRRSGDRQPIQFSDKKSWRSHLHQRDVSRGDALVGGRPHGLPQDQGTTHTLLDSQCAITLLPILKVVSYLVVFNRGKSWRQLSLPTFNAQEPGST